MLRTEGTRREKPSLAWVGNSSEMSRTAPEHPVGRPACNLSEPLGELEMPTSNQAFDSHLETWKREQTMPWSRVRLKVEISNLLRHVGQSGLKILDAGGGNGYATIPFAQNGCQVVVADYSEAMLTDGQKLMSELGLDKSVSFVLTRLEDLSSVIHDQEFDVVLCHSVLQYVESIPVVLRSILRPLKSQGVVSIICLNRYSIAYHQAFLRGDLQAAKAAIGATETNTIYGSQSSPPANQADGAVQRSVPHRPARGRLIRRPVGRL